MHQRVVAELSNGSERSKAQTLADVRRITRKPDYTPSSWRELCGKLFVTCYMASQFSGTETRGRAATLAEEIGSVRSPETSQRRSARSAALAGSQRALTSPEQAPSAC